MKHGTVIVCRTWNVFRFKMITCQNFSKVWINGRIPSKKSVSRGEIKNRNPNVKNRKNKRLEKKYHELKKYHFVIFSKRISKDSKNPVSFEDKTWLQVVIDGNHCRCLRLGMQIVGRLVDWPFDDCAIRARERRAALWYRLAFPCYLNSRTFTQLKIDTSCIS